MWVPFCVTWGEGHARGSNTLDVWMWVQFSSFPFLMWVGIRCVQNVGLGDAWPFYFSLWNWIIFPVLVLALGLFCCYSCKYLIANVMPTLCTRDLFYFWNDLFWFWNFVEEITIGQNSLLGPTFGGLLLFCGSWSYSHLVVAVPFDIHSFI